MVSSTSVAPADWWSSGGATTSAAASGTSSHSSRLSFDRRNTSKTRLRSAEARSAGRHGRCRPGRIIWPRPPSARSARRTCHGSPQSVRCTRRTESDDVLVLASTARAAAHALLAVGRFDDAVEMGNTAARWLADHLADPDPAALSLLGMLHLRTAIAAARRMDRATTTELLDKAETAATRVGADIDHWHTSFGPTNVAVHRLSAALRTSGTSPGSPNEGRTWTSRVFLPNAGSPTSPISPGRWPTWLRDLDEAPGSAARRRTRGTGARPAQRRGSRDRQGDAATCIGHRCRAILEAGRPGTAMSGGAVSPRGDGPVVALVVSGAGGVEEVRGKFVRPAVERGWSVPVTATPTGGHWLADKGETTPARAAHWVPGARRGPATRTRQPAPAGRLRRRRTGQREQRRETRARDRRQPGPDTRVRGHRQPCNTGRGFSPHQCRPRAAPVMESARTGSDIGRRSPDSRRGRLAALRATVRTGRPAAAVVSHPRSRRQAPRRVGKRPGHSVRPGIVSRA